MQRHEKSGSGKRVLVTGGAGFLGSHLCRSLLDDGYEVVSVDNFHTGSEDNILALRETGRFRSIRHDVVEPLEVEADLIFNLACPASPVHYQHDPIRTTRTSVLGALNLLDLATRREARILQGSTSEVYGDPMVHPQPEAYFGNVNPTGIRACYDEGKRCAESLFFDFHRQRGTAIKVARIFNTYGPQMNPEDGRVVSNFIVQALKREPITVYGDGTQTRSFCYVDDLIVGLRRLMDTRPDVTGPVNLGNPGEFTMNELAKLVLDITGSSSRIVHKTLPQDDPRQRRPDISQAERLLGWTPHTGLVEGLKKTVAYFEARLSRKESAAA